MSCDQCSNIWKQTSNWGLCFLRILNNDAMSTRSISTFWQKLQANLKNLNDSRLKGWYNVIMMHIEIDDDKFHLNHKMDADNSRRVCRIRDNKFGIFCHILAFTSTYILVSFEFETQNNTTTIPALRLM